LNIIFKGAELKDEVIFGDFKEADFIYNAKFHVFISVKLKPKVPEQTQVY